MSRYTEKPIVGIFDATIFDDKAFFDAAYFCMDEARRKKIDACRDLKDKKLSLAAGVLLRSELKKLGITDFKIEYEDNGKPHLTDKRINFNLSHSGNLAACVLFGGEVGIDIQEIRCVSDALIRKVTTEPEYKFLSSLGEREKTEAFFRIWAIKESYLKFLGTGLGVSMARLEVSLKEEITIKHDGKTASVVFEEHNIEGYKLAVCHSSIS